MLVVARLHIDLHVDILQTDGRPDSELSSAICKGLSSKRRGSYIECAELEAVWIEVGAFSRVWRRAWLSRMVWTSKGTTRT